MADMRKELQTLARQLRFRAEQSDGSDWRRAGKKAKTPAPAPKDMDALRAEILACRKCPLGGARLNAVPGVGSTGAQVMFVGEGPGFDEDHKGEPFIGRSGQLLDKIMASIGLSRETVFIANIVKCHPMVDPTNPESRGNDRPPSNEEIAACRPFLDEQIAVIQPKVIVTLGAVAARVLLGTDLGISKFRGQWKVYEPADGGRPVKLLPTYHPAALLRNPDLKRDVWEDMKNLRKELAS